MACEIVRLNVGGRGFDCSRSTLCAKDSMLASLASATWSGASATDKEGRVFVDRDPAFFGLILNFLRDGTCTLPESGRGRRELLQEADFYQLSELRSFILEEGQREEERRAAAERERARCSVASMQYSATSLRSCIASRLETDAELRSAIDLLLRCAFGSNPRDASLKIPPRQQRVQVSLQETALNPLASPQTKQHRGETLYVAFQQQILFQGFTHAESYQKKHESQLVYEGGELSYDPAEYGGTFAERQHIKALQVYRWHCIEKLPEKAQQLRGAVLHLLLNPHAAVWALELCGFKEVCVKVHSDTLPNLSPLTEPLSQEAERNGAFATPVPTLANVSIDVYFSL